MWTKTFTLILIVITSFQALSQGFRNPFGVTRLKKIQKESGQHPDSAVSFTHEMTFEKKAANRIVADSSSYNKVLSISRDQLKNRYDLPANVVLQQQPMQATEDQTEKSKMTVELQYETLSLEIDPLPEENHSIFNRGNSRPFDSRFELLELDFNDVDNTNALMNSFSVFGVVQRDYLDFKPEKNCTVVNASTSGEKFKLCENEPYRNQITLCIGTAFLIDKQHVVTAKHVVESVAIEDLVLIAGFRWLSDGGTVRTSFNANEVLYPNKILTSFQLDEHDLVIIQLTDSTTAYTPLKVKEDHVIKVQDRVYSLGYPLGLPIKLTTNASISEIVNDYNCASTLDTYQGNSGSPVFDFNSHEVIGMLTGGSPDFTNHGNCNQSNLCVSTFCKRESFLSFSRLYKIIQNTISATSGTN